MTVDYQNAVMSIRGVFADPFAVVATKTGEELGAAVAEFDRAVRLATGSYGPPPERVSAIFSNREVEKALDELALIQGFSEIAAQRIQILREERSSVRASANDLFSTLLTTGMDSLSGTIGLQTNSA